MCEYHACSQESNYEALFHHDGVFYVVRESIKLKKDSKTATYHAIIEELKLGEAEYVILNQCPSAFQFEGTRCAAMIQIHFDDTHLFLIQS